jgi:hypothetical protein
MQRLAPKTQIKMVMLQRGLKPRDIAEGTGLGIGYIYQLISGVTACKKGRQRVESFLGAPIWSTPEEFEIHSQTLRRSPK